ncbi:MAG: ion channel [Myxococcales bacterium]
MSADDLLLSPEPDDALAFGPSDLLAVVRELENEVRQAVEANPMEATTLLVAGGGLLFFWAERGRNEKVKSYWDAVHYVATSLSVGYATIFPETDAGKALGALVQTLGPALSSRVLNPPPQPERPADALVAEKLDAILAELKRIGGLSGAAR